MLRFRKDPARLVLLVIVWMTAFAKGLAAAEPEDRPRLIRADTRDRIPGQYIVILDDETLPGDSVPTLADDLLRTHGGTVRIHLQNAVRGFSANLTEDQALRLSRDPRVLLVEENARAYLSSEQTLPADNSLWHLDRVDQRTAVGSGDDKYRYCETGSERQRLHRSTRAINKKHQEFLLPNGQSRVLNGVKFAVGSPRLARRGRRLRHVSVRRMDGQLCRRPRHLRRVAHRGKDAGCREGGARRFRCASSRAPDTQRQHRAPLLGARLDQERFEPPP